MAQETTLIAGSVLVFTVFFSFIATMTWLRTRRKEREAYYRNETTKKVAEMQGSGVNALEFLREEERISLRRRTDGQKLGGLISMAVGVGTMVFLKAIMASDVDPAAHQAYLVGLIPFLVGAVLLIYSSFLAAKS